MQKTGIFLNHRTVLQTGKVLPTGSKPIGLSSNSLWHLNTILQTGKVIPANPKVITTNIKVNRANAQSASGGFHLHWQMASCVLSTSKRFQYLKTTCPHCLMQGEKRAPKSAFLIRYSKGDRLFATTEKVGGFGKKVRNIY